MAVGLSKVTPYRERKVLGNSTALNTLMDPGKHNVLQLKSAEINPVPSPDKSEYRVHSLSGGRYNETIT